MFMFNLKSESNTTAPEKGYFRLNGAKRKLTIWLSLGLTLVAFLLVQGLPIANADMHYMVTNANDSGPGSLRQAILDGNAASSNGYHYIDFDGQLEGSTITLQSALPTITRAAGINYTVYFPNEPHPRVTIDGQGKYRIFTANTDFVINYLNLVNGYANQDSPLGAYGAALYETGVDTDIAYCNFINNRVESNQSGGMAAGGAVYFGAKPFGLTGFSVFTNNTAKGIGGASAQGGAFWASGGTSPNVFIGDQFNQNSATADNTSASAAGGAVYLSNSSDVQIYQDTSFTGNFTGGTINSPNTHSSGGALALVSSTADISNTIFTGNIAAKGATALNAVTSHITSQGGAIFSGTNSTLTMGIGTKFVNNQASFGQGGGLWSNGPTTMTGAYFYNNSAYIAGGGFYNYSGTADIRRSTFAANTTSGTDSFYAPGNGGAIYSLTSNVILANSTISGNSASGKGGAFYQNSGLDYIYNSTITLNTATNGGGLTAGANNIYLQNTIVAQNTATINSPNLFKLSAGFISQGNNLIDDTSSTPTAITPVAGDKFNAAAQPLNLGPLQDNGGPTPTRHPLPESQAVGAGSNSGCDNAYVGSVDQRGVRRPYPANLSCDIGAVEVIILGVDDPGDEGDYTDDGDCLTSHGLCTLRAALEQPFPASAPIWINFFLPGNGPFKI